MERSPVTYISYFFANATAYLLLFMIAYSFMLVSLSQEGRALKKVNYFYLALFMMLFSGLRWNCGTDWEPYKVVFDSICAGTKNIDEHFDAGYVLLNKIIAVFSQDYTFFLLVDSFLAIFLICKAVQKNHNINKNVALYIFFLNYFCVHYMGSNRRIIAIGFLLNAFVAFFERKYLMWLILQVLAFHFHRASIVGVLGVFLPRQILTSKKIYILITISTLLGLFQFSIKFISQVANIALRISSNQIFRLVDYYSSSIHEGKSAISFFFAVAKRAIFVFIFLYYRKRYKIEDLRFNYYLNIYVFAVVFYSLLNGTGQFLSLTTYFTIIEIFIWGILFKILNRHDKLNMLLFLVFFGIFQMLNNFTTYTTAFLPYKSILIY